ELCVIHGKYYKCCYVKADPNIKDPIVYISPLTREFMNILYGQITNVAVVDPSKWNMFDKVKKLQVQISAPSGSRSILIVKEEDVVEAIKKQIDGLMMNKGQTYLLNVK